MDNFVVAVRVIVVEKYKTGTEMIRVENINNFSFPLRIFVNDYWCPGRIEFYDFFHVTFSSGNREYNINRHA